MEQNNYKQNELNHAQEFCDNCETANPISENQEPASAFEGETGIITQDVASPVGIESQPRDNFRWIWFLLGLISGFICLISTIFHYTNIYYGNPVSWISWLTGLLFLILAVFPSWKTIQPKLAALPARNIYLFLALAAFFILSHFWNFKTAPWNQNGLFDDAAWDIYFAKNYIFSGAPFQPAFFDFGISREVVFHYYITFWFKLFGANLLTFNISLILLGLITFLFTCLLVHKLFNNWPVTITAGVLLNFLPLHYIHTFAGHRYAIAAPLIMSSLYFLYTGFKDRSPFRIVISAILAALCVDSAIMGKQYLMGIFGALLLISIFNYQKIFNKTTLKLVMLFGISLIIAMVPLLVYIYYNQIYFVHERDLINTFLTAYRANGINGLKPYIDKTLEVFFRDFSYNREFIWEFVLIPFSYFVFLIPGIFFALIRKRFEIVLLATIPVAGAFVSECYDFRVLHAAPFWIILMAFAFIEIFKVTSSLKHKIFQIFGLTVMFGLLLFGLIPGIQYINGKSKDPNSIWLLPQKDVAISRYLRDVTAGVPNPSPNWRYQEFNKLPGYPEPNYDTLICQNLGYAITHLFLKDYDDKKIMAFSDQDPFDLLNELDILNVNKNTIINYQTGAKDLKLIWEIQNKTKRIIAAFMKLNYLGADRVLTSGHAGESFSFYVLTIKNQNINLFKHKVAEIRW
jgi:hypothetical protein